MDGPWKAYFELKGKSLEDTMGLIKDLSDQSSRALWYYHAKGRKGKGPHVHALLYDYKYSDETFRKTVKKVLDVKGKEYGVSNKYNKGTIMKEEETAHYVKYMSKGVHDPIYNKGFDEGWITLAKAMWIPEDVNANANAIASATVSSVNKITNAKIAREAYAKYMEREDANDDVINARINMGDLIDIVADICKSYNKGRNYDNISKICQDVLCDLSPRHWKAKILSRL